MNGFDIDGVLYFGMDRPGIRPGPDDVIISGRSWEETPETIEFMVRHGINNRIYLNPAMRADKTREGSGAHKAATLNALREAGEVVDLFFEDDPVQAEIIKRSAPWVNVVMVVHDLTEK